LNIGVERNLDYHIFDISIWPERLVLLFLRTHFPTTTPIGTVEISFSLRSKDAIDHLSEARMMRCDNIVGAMRRPLVAIATTPKGGDDDCR
jgi:hypothetical protein